MTVNDGKGFYDSTGMINTLIIDCNELPKALFQGQYVHFCAKICEMVQKLSALKDGIEADRKSLEEQIADLKRFNNDLAEIAYGLPVNKGEENGTS